MLNKLNKNKRGQISESLTWVVATFILIAILLIFIYVSIALSKTKSIKVNIRTSLGDSFDWIDKKTEMAYSINSANRDEIDEWISRRGENG